MLFANRELAGFYQLAIFIKQLEDVNTTGKICKVDGGLIGNNRLFDHFPSQEIIDL